MTRYGWAVWGLLAVEFFVAMVATCTLGGRPLWWWPAWVIPAALSVVLLIALRKWRL